MEFAKKLAKLSAIFSGLSSSLKEVTTVDSRKWRILKKIEQKDWFSDTLLFRMCLQLELFVPILETLVK